MNSFIFHWLIIYIPATGSIQCSFDSNFCSWIQDKTDNFDWTRKRGATSSGATGPSADHTSGSKILFNPLPQNAAF